MSTVDITARSASPPCSPRTGGALAWFKALVQAGVLEKREYSDTPPRSDYHLTRAGRELTPVLQALLEWGDKWAVAAPPSPSSTTITRCAAVPSAPPAASPCASATSAGFPTSPGWDITGPASAGLDISQRTRPQ